MILPPAGPLVPGVERIAVLRANAVGDFVLTLPALDALRAAYPAAHITLLATPWHQEFLSDRPGPWNAVEVVPPSTGVRVDAPPASAAELDAFWTRQRGRGYDLAVQLHGGGAGSNAFMRRLGARLTAGSRALGALPLDRAIAYAHWQHEILRQLEVVALVGAVPVTLEPRLAVTDADRRAAEAVLPTDQRPLVVVHPGARDPRRRWPPDRFAAVADELAVRGARVVLVGGPEDRPLAAAVAAAARKPIEDVSARLTLAGTAGVMERSTVVVANDSGPRHLAAAVGAPTVGVYLVANLVAWGPLTRSRHRVAVSTRTSCPDCGADLSAGQCPHDSSLVAAVPVAEVLENALALSLAGTLRRRAG